MLSRRKFMTLGSAAFCVGICDPHALSSITRPKLSAGTEANAEGVSRYVDVRIGTGGHGHCYPGATVPYGMVQLSPDTYNKGWDWCSGYNYSDDSIMGFSHTHLSGTGIGDMLDILVMPGTGAVRTQPGTREYPGSGYRSRFSHTDEHAVPGYYSVLLRDSAILAELKATARAGVHRYTFPKRDDGYIIVDLATWIQRWPGRGAVERSDGYRRRHTGWRQEHGALGQRARNLLRHEVLTAVPQHRCSCRRSSDAEIIGPHSRQIHQGRLAL